MLPGFAQVTLVLFWLVIVPLVVGHFVQHQVLKRERENLIYGYVVGTLSTWAVFYLLDMIYFVLQLTLSQLVWTWVLIILIILSWTFIKFRNSLADALMRFWISLTQLTWPAYLALALVAIQAFILVWYSFEDADDSFYVVVATTAVKTNSIFKYDTYSGGLYTSLFARYVLSPFPMFYALISQLTFIHPTLLAHTILPLVYLPLSYLVFYLIAADLLKHNNKQIAVLMLFLNVAHLMGGTTRFTNAIYLLGRAWQGKSVLANVILPALVCFSYQYFRDYQRPHNRDWLMILSVILAGCLISSLSVAMLPVVLFTVAGIYAWRLRQWRPLMTASALILPCVALGVIFLLIE